MKSCRSEHLVYRAQSPGAERVRRSTPTVLLRLVAAVAFLLAVRAAPALADPLDLEKLDGPTAIKMMENGQLTSVKLTQAYVERIEALNKRGPGLNAVTQLNQDALAEAAQMDAERAQGIVRGPAHGHEKGEVLASPSA